VLDESFSSQAQSSFGGRLTGDPSYLGEGVEEPEAEVDEEGNELPQREVFREMHRLSHLVGRIDEEASIVPRGALLVNGGLVDLTDIDHVIFLS